MIYESKEKYFLILPVWVCLFLDKEFFLKDYFLSLNMYYISELLLDVFLSKIYIKECNWIWVNFHLGHLGTCEVTESGKYLIRDNNRLFCQALSSVHATFLTVSWCHIQFVPKAVCLKCCTYLYQEPEKISPP